MKLVYIILLIALLGVGVALVWFYQCQDDSCLIFAWQRGKVIDSFAKCAAAGNPIMESYPRQCVANDKTFTESIQPIGNEKIQVSEPLPNAIVQSPLTIKGQARGTWYFEASFPVKLIDANGQELAAAPAQAQSDWMTQDFVPFEAVLNFAAPQTATGFLILEKDNPSDLPQNADSISVPVRFR